MNSLEMQLPTYHKFVEYRDGAFSITKFIFRVVFHMVPINIISRNKILPWLPIILVYQIDI